MGEGFVGGIIGAGKFLINPPRAAAEMGAALGRFSVGWDKKIATAWALYKGKSFYEQGRSIGQIFGGIESGIVVGKATGYTYGQAKNYLGTLAQRQAAIQGSTTAGSSSALSPYRYTRAGETFRHYSYVKHADNLAAGLEAGSYGTSAEGLTGIEAQQGLALTHEMPPDAVYSIAPPAETLIRVNPITEPNILQPGGLPEVEFIFGTPPGSVSGPTIIPGSNP